MKKKNFTTSFIFVFLLGIVSWGGNVVEHKTYLSASKAQNNVQDQSNVLDKVRNVSNGRKELEKANVISDEVNQSEKTVYKKYSAGIELAAGCRVTFEENSIQGESLINSMIQIYRNGEKLEDYIYENNSMLYQIEEKGHYRFWVITEKGNCYDISECLEIEKGDTTFLREDFEKEINSFTPIFET